MQNIINPKARLLLILLSILLLSSCGVKKSAADIENDFRRQFPNVKYEILEKSTNENAKNPEEFSVELKAKDLQDNFIFNIYSIVKENAGLGLIEGYETDYPVKKLQFINDQLGSKVNGFELKFGEKYKPGAINLYFKYTSKNTLEEKIHELENYLLIVFDLENNIDINVNAIFDLVKVDNGAEQQNPSPSSMKFSPKDFDKNITLEDNIKNKIDTLEDIAFRNYAISSRKILLPNNDYPLSLIKEAPKYNGFISHFSVKANGKNYVWDDLITEQFDILHYRVLYEVLKRTEYKSLEGTSSSYSFIGKDNKKYEFNDKFNDKLLDDNSSNSDNKKHFNYYLADGEVEYFTTASTRYLAFEKLKEITGYEFARVKVEE